MRSRHAFKAKDNQRLGSANIIISESRFLSVTESRFSQSYSGESRTMRRATVLEKLISSNKDTLLSLCAASLNASVLAKGCAEQW